MIIICEQMWSEVYNVHMYICILWIKIVQVFILVIAWMEGHIKILKEAILEWPEHDRIGVLCRQSKGKKL